MARDDEVFTFYNVHIVVSADGRFRGVCVVYADAPESVTWGEADKRYRSTAEPDRTRGRPVKCTNCSRYGHRTMCEHTGVRLSLALYKRITNKRRYHDRKRTS